MPHRDAYYWTSRDSDSEAEAYHDPRPKEPFIDPWDLENYAYIREHLESMELSSDPSGFMSGSSGEFAEANSSSFFYVPGTQQMPVSRTSKHEEHQVNSQFDSLVDHANYVAIDEVNALYDRPPEYIYESRRMGPPHEFQDSYEQSNDESSFEDGAALKDNSVFGIYDTAGHFRKVAVPVPVSSETLTTQRDRSISFSYGDYDCEPYVNRQEIYSKLEDDLSGRSEPTIPIYDDVLGRNRRTPNFGLSNYGHLKIDYSYSWNNLNKYIKCNN